MIYKAIKDTVDVILSDPLFQEVDVWFTFVNLCMSKNDRFIPLRIILNLIILMAVLYKVNCAFMQQKEKNCQNWTVFQINKQQYLLLR